MPLQLSSSRCNNHPFHLIYFAVTLPLLSTILIAATLALSVSNVTHPASLGSTVPSSTAFRIPTNTTWYFPEGSVGGGFQQYFTFLNPDLSSTSTVSITYIEETNPPTIKHFTHSVNAHSRLTVNVNIDLNIPASSSTHISVAAIVKVTSGPGIVAERPLYFNNSGNDVIGATQQSTSYYFPEADTRQAGSAHYRTFLNILNAGTVTANVKITYYTGSCGNPGQSSCPTETKSISAQNRIVAQPDDVGLHQKLAIGITSDNPVVAERAMYFSDNIPNAGGSISTGTMQIGATAPAKDWLFAEGSTGTNRQEYFELANFGSTAAHVDIKLEYSNGNTQTVRVTVNPLTWYQFDVNNANAHPGPCVPSPCMITSDVSAEITSDNPIVADRLLYFHYGSSNIPGATDVIGKVAPAKKTYAFAEGYTAGSTTEYLTLQNPTNNDETVDLTLFLKTQTLQQQVTVTAHSRKTININSIVNPIAPGDVSMVVHAVGKGSVIVAERPMFFIYNNADPGGSDVIGYTGG